MPQTPPSAASPRANSTRASSPLPANALQGLHILITRPEAQATRWAQQLTALGANVSLQAAMIIAPLHDAPSKQNIIDRVLLLDQYQKVIFISQNAVQYGLQWIDDYWPQLPIGVEFLAIGKATAQALLQYDASVVVHSATEAMNSESLLADESLQAIHGDKILIFRGQGGRDHLATQLQARGAQVDYCELYQRTPPHQPQTLDLEFKHTEQCPITAVHSGESLSNLCNMLTPEEATWIKQHPLLLPGERVAELAIQAGFTQIITAKNATHQCMTEALYDWKK